MKRYNSPPNWPPPPPGWQPDPSWRPDPAWGPAPAGWVFWVDEHDWNRPPSYGPVLNRPNGTGVTPGNRTRKKGRVWLAVSLAAVALFAGCAVIGTVLGNSSPASQLEAKDRSPVPQTQIDAAQELSERDLALLVKDPDSHAGQVMVIYARITQFDAATGKCLFRANISFKKMEQPWEYGDNAVFRGGDGKSTCPGLEGFVADDEVRITATSLGSLSYETQLRGSTTVPAFKVENISSVK